MAESRAYRIGDLVLQPHRQVLADGQRLALGSKALALLSVLAEAGGGLVTKDELMEAVWPGVIVEENAIQVHIVALRKAMGAAAEALVTVRGLGYRLDAALDTGQPVVAPAAPVMVSPQRADQQLLAVLPFDNLSSDAEMAFFSDGVSEEILGRITRGSKLTVIGRTSSFQFRGTDKARAATMLGASHILDGSIQRAGGRVRISAHLVEAATQTNLWSNHYDRGLDDIFALQDEIAEAIATSLDTAFSLVRAAPVDPAVYDLYLRAKVRVTNIVQMEKNVASLEHVTQMDAHFTAGWGTIAYRRAELMMHSPYAQRATIRAHVEGDIARCRALDPGHPDANAAAWVLMEPYGAFLKQDAALNSNSVADFDSVDFLTARAYFLECVGRGTEAAEQAAEAAALDGLNAFAVGMRGQALWRAGQFARGRAVMESVHARWPDSHHTVAVLIQACVHQLDWPRVERLTDPERLAIYPLREHAGVVGFARVMREPGAANRCRMFDAICKRAKATGHIDPQVAAIAAELGFVGEVYDLLDQMKFGPAGHHRDVMGTHAYRTLLLFPKAYRALRDDPRFVTLCARLGLVDYWLTTRHWPDCADDVPYDFRGECARAVDVRRDIFGF